MYFNSSTPSVAYKHQWIGSALVQIMACRLLGAKPLSKPMVTYCQLDLREQTSVKFESKYKTFHSRKCIWKCCRWNGGHFVQGGDELTYRILVTYNALVNFCHYYFRYSNSNGLSPGECLAIAWTSDDILSVQTLVKKPLNFKLLKCL